MALNRLRSAYFFLLVLLFALNGCRPSENEFINEFDIVYTTYDTNFNFEGKSTFFLPDTVVILGAGEDNAEVHRFDDLILEALSRYMISMGWEKLNPDSGEAADLVLLPMISTTDFSSCIMPCWNCGWGGWGGWGAYPWGWGAGWGWGFPPVMGCSSFSTGSLYVTLSDPNNVNEIAQEIPVVWTGVINGLLQGSDQNIASRLEFNISQMFTQSPYLKKQS